MNYANLKQDVQTAKRQSVSPARQMKGIVDQRPEFAAQRKLIDGIQNSSGVAQCSLKIGTVVYTFMGKAYYVGGKKVKDFQSVIAKIKAKVEKEPREKAGEEKYKWNNNWNKIVAGFIKCKEMMIFSDIKEFISKIEATVIEDSETLDKLLMSLSVSKDKIKMSKEGAIPDDKQEQISAVGMERELNEIILAESDLEKKREGLDEALGKRRSDIQIIENKLIQIKELAVTLSKSQGSVKGICPEAAKQDLEKAIKLEEAIKLENSVKNQLGEFINTLVAARQKLDEETAKLAKKRQEIMNYQQEKSLHISAFHETGVDSDIYWNDIAKCRKIIKKYPLSEKTEDWRMRLFDVEMNLAKKSPEMNDNLLPVTKQKQDTTMCWFLSVFEGLRRAGLVYPIFERLEQDPDKKFIFNNVLGFQDWQLLLEHKFMEKNGVRVIGPRIFRPKNSLDGVNGEKIMKAFFNGEGTGVPGVLFKYKYSLKEDITLKFKDNKTVSLGLVLENLPEKGDVQVGKISGEISFYTVDKLGHAMFYLGRYCYYNEKTDVELKVKKKEKKLLSIGKEGSKKIDKALENSGLKGLARVNKRSELVKAAKLKLLNELKEIEAIPITSWAICVYNQSHQAKQTYRLGEIERIQKHTFTLKEEFKPDGKKKLSLKDPVEK